MVEGPGRDRPGSGASRPGAGLESSDGAGSDRARTRDRRRRLAGAGKDPDRSGLRAARPCRGRRGVLPRRDRARRGGEGPHRGPGLDRVLVCEPTAPPPRARAALGRTRAAVGGVPDARRRSCARLPRPPGLIGGGAGADGRTSRRRRDARRLARDRARRARDVSHGGRAERLRLDDGPAPGFDPGDARAGVQATRAPRSGRPPDGARGPRTSRPISSRPRGRSRSSCGPTRSPSSI